MNRFDNMLAAITAVGVLLNGAGAFMTWWQSRHNSKAIAAQSQNIQKIETKLAEGTVDGPRGAGYGAEPKG